MKTVTYLDLEEAAPVVEVQGVTFESEKSVEVSDELAAFLEKNKFFEVERGEEAVVHQSDGANASTFERAQANGVKARAAGKARKVPPAYSGKPEGDFWLAGYDEGEDA